MWKLCYVASAQIGKTAQNVHRGPSVSQGRSSARASYLRSHRHNSTGTHGFHQLTCRTGASRGTSTQPLLTKLQQWKPHAGSDPSAVVPVPVLCHLLSCGSPRSQADDGFFKPWWDHEFTRGRFWLWTETDNLINGWDGLLSTSAVMKITRSDGLNEQQQEEEEEESVFSFPSTSALVMKPILTCSW